MDRPFIFIGFDSREREAYDVAKFSILRRASKPVTVIPLKLHPLQQWLLTRPVVMRDGKMWCPISQAPMATEFAISRFCVPLLRSKGWALFVDCDVVALGDINELFALADDKYAIMCVKHDPAFRAWKSQLQGQPPRAYWALVGSAFFFKDQHDGCAWKKVPIEESPRDSWEVFGNEANGIVADLRSDYTKMDDQIQTLYIRKNWSSVMLWNCAHPSNKKLTETVLNTWPGRDLHAFKWLDDSEIGELPKEWNYLDGVYPFPNPDIKIAHLTLGGPWIKDWNRSWPGPAQMDLLWTIERDEMLKAGKT